MAWSFTNTRKYTVKSGYYSECQYPDKITKVTSMGPDIKDYLYRKYIPLVFIKNIKIILYSLWIPNFH